MPLKPCLDCGALSNGPRCPECADIRRRQSNARVRNIGGERRPGRDAAERRRRALAVAQHRALVGDWCPGWQCAPHPATDLTADHLIPVAAGGAESGALIVRCRSCNSRRGKRTD